MEGNGKGRGGREKRGKAKKSRGTERKEREDIGLVPVVDPVGRVAVAILAFCRRNIPHVYCVISVFNVFYCFCLLPLTTLVHLTVGSCSCFLVYNLFTSDKRGGKCVCPRLFVCLSVCLCARLLKKRVHDLDEMLRVDRCRDMDELINF